MRTIPGMREYIKPLDHIIDTVFLPTLLDTIISGEDRELCSLPIRHGGLGIPNLSETSEMQFQNSKAITLPLVTVMILQHDQMPDETIPEMNEIKKQKTQERENYLVEKAKNITEGQPLNTAKAGEESKMPGASSWLSALPLEEYGFALNKSEFRDSINLRYNKPLKGLPTTCPCGQRYDMNHAMNCKRGGFVTIRHNNIRDYEASLLSKIAADVEVEPELQPVEGENIAGLVGDNSKPDI